MPPPKLPALPSSLTCAVDEATEPKWVPAVLPPFGTMIAPVWFLSRSSHTVAFQEHCSTACLVQGYVSPVGRPELGVIGIHACLSALGQLVLVKGAVTPARMV